MRTVGLRPIIALILGAGGLHAEPAPQADSFDRQLEAEVSRIESEPENEVPTKESWLAEQKESRRRLAEMLGLDPQPPRGDLHATKTGEFEHEGIVVENLHYQSIPGLYVTANLYRPKSIDHGVPAVLYLCGHANKVKAGVSYGNKAGYEHHGVWYAKHGFICLMIDTVQLGEIRGSHKGTHSDGRWHWISRGYTPAGVEAWAGIRGIDYLQTRSDVDRARIGVTGRSGGGAYSWWVAALDERVTCAAPTAGITTLRDHVVHKCVYGHCDCMFMVNTYRWDYDQVASLVAPRPLLIANTDKDDIFPVEGVFDVFKKTRSIYQLLGAEKNLGLQIAEGAHQDVQPLNVGEFHWMLRHLQGQPSSATFDGAAVRAIPMEKLKVFDKLPADEINTTIDRTLVPVASHGVPASREDWERMKTSMMAGLREKVFAAWPDTAPVLTPSADRVVSQGIAAEKYTLRPLGPDTEPSLDLFLIQPETISPGQPEQVTLNILDDSSWEGFSDTFGDAFPSLFPGRIVDTSRASDLTEHPTGRRAMAYLCPRGTGPYKKSGTPKDETQLRRSFYLVGGTLESWQVWDIRTAVAQLGALPRFKGKPVEIRASGPQSINALYASLFEPAITRLDLHDVPSSHLGETAPAYLNVLKYLDIPDAAAMAADRSQVVIHTKEPEAWRTAQGIPRKEDPYRGLKIVAASADTPLGKEE